MMKKDSIIRLLRLFIGGSLFAYVAVLYNTNAIISVPEENSRILLAIIALIALFILAMGIFMLCIKKARILQIIFGIILIFFAWYSGLRDDPTNYVYIKDILYVLWSIMLVVWAGGWCIAESCKQKQEEEEIEIIEV